MNSILRVLFRGELNPSERKSSQSKVIADFISQIAAEEKYFKTKLSPEDQDRFENYTKLYSAMGAIEDDDLFAYAFSLGLLFAFDAAREAERIFVSDDIDTEAEQE